MDKGEGLERAFPNLAYPHGRHLYGHRNILVHGMRAGGMVSGSSRTESIQSTSMPPPHIRQPCMGGLAKYPLLLEGGTCETKAAHIKGRSC